MPDPISPQPSTPTVLIAISPLSIQSNGNHENTKPRKRNLYKSLFWSFGLVVVASVLTSLTDPTKAGRHVRKEQVWSSSCFRVFVVAFVLLSLRVLVSEAVR